MSLRGLPLFMELRIPPVIVALLAAVCMWMVARWMPLATFTVPNGRLVFAATFATGIVITAAGILQFRRAKTTVDPVHPQAASSLVTRGIYRKTRNPMYLGFVLVLIAWSLYLANVASVLLVGVFVAYMTRFQIIPEERILASKFATAFSEYRRQVRRWL